MFRHLGRFCTSYPWIICVAWLLAGIALTLYAPSWDARTQDDDVRFLPDRYTSVRAYQILEKAFPSDVYASRLIFVVEREDEPLTSQDLRLVDQLTNDLHRLKADSPNLKIGAITSYKDGLIGGRLTSKDKQCTLIHVSLKTPFLALQTRDTVDKAKEVLRKRIDDAGPNVPKVYTTGQAGIGHDLVTATSSSLDDTTTATIVLVIVVLLLVYRSPLLALVPLVTIAVSVWVSLKLLALMTMIPGVHLVNVSKVFAIVILYGAGTDYCLFLIGRYREELHNGYSNEGALTKSVGAVGGALMASAGTVMCGLGLMALAEFAKVRYSGPGIALSLAVGLVAALTLTPALLRILGNLVFWPGRAPLPRSLSVGDGGLAKQSLWDRISHQVVRRPGMIFSGAVLLLLPLACLGFQAQPDYKATSQLSPNSESLQGLEALKKHFIPGETGPMTVLLVSEKDWKSQAGRQEIQHLSKSFGGIDNVAEVRSLTQPLGTPLPDLPKMTGTGAMVMNLFQAVNPAALDRLKHARKAACKHYVSTMASEDETARTLSVTRLDVIFKTDPFSDESTKTMKVIQMWLDTHLSQSEVMGDVQSETYGVMVGANDLANVTESDRFRVNIIISLSILLILFLIVRKPFLACYLLITVLFSYYATLGATMLAGYIWQGEILYQLDWRVMFFLFTILVAVGEDYNILLMDRAVQEGRRHGPIEGMRRALARTGGTITSCGIIMAGTFATLMLARLTTLLQIGFALAFGVLVDTFIVRPFLVPSFAVMLAEGEDSPEEEEDKDNYEDRIPPAFRLAG
ncbi:MAG: MMPL family transporter [Gemmataceae bacterium]